MTRTPIVANNARVLRRLCVLVLAAAVQAAAFRAPLVHAHAGDHDADHHAAGEVHAHFGGHGAEAPADGLTLAAADHDDARYLKACAGIAAAGASSAAVAVPPFTLVAPAEQPSRQSLRVVNGHDPPCTDSGAPRAPPALLI